MNKGCYAVDGQLVASCVGVDFTLSSCQGYPHNFLLITFFPVTCI